MSNIHTIVHYEAEATVVECVESKLSDEMTIQAWSEEVKKAIETTLAPTRVIVNFSRVRFMSSSALRALITLRTLAASTRVPLILCNISEANMEVFKITKLDSIFRIIATETEARRAIVK